ncbi:ABC transporter permease [Reinekea blandensis]|uniref:ABC-type arginine transport system, permease component n=1 Tax=Reinekea blandensis MED297 TaxID=314283 RepID=A4BK48_9GAMM|nr:ABC transporter permease [Reinekea blandensis]EAR07477.1 ABC-type arginine transport system, permease component [Reinekea sp. MED297] [Reinekea blandensis MED297]
MFDFEGYGPGIFKGAILTMELAALSLVLAFTLGLLGAMGKLSKNRMANGVATTYTTIIRGVPDLVWMMLLYFGGQIMVNAFFDWLYNATDGQIDIFFPFNEFLSGVLTIGFIFGAYMTETFRGAFMAVDAGQIEAGKAYGMSSWQIFRRISFPQMMRHALPGIANNWQVLLKTTALVSIIGLADMVRLATEAAKSTGEPFKFFIPVAIVYLGIAALSDVLFKKLNTVYSAGVVKG